MATHERPARLREAVEKTLGVRLTKEERAILAGRLRFDDTPALSQQAIAARLGRSQPHISNVERQLVKKLDRAAQRRADQESTADDLYSAYEAMMKEAETLGQKLPPKRFRLRRRRTAA